MARAKNKLQRQIEHGAATTADDFRSDHRFDPALKAAAPAATAQKRVAYSSETTHPPLKAVVAPKSPPPALDSLNGPRSHPNDVLIVSIDDVLVSPHNPRADQPVENLDAMVENIARFGQLHTISCHKLEDGYGAFNGRRRLAAIRALRDQSRHDGRVKITVLDDDEDAAGVVLSEETMQVPMNPADKARLFAKMFDCERRAETTPDETVTTIAKVFGLTTTDVKGSLELALLHPPILTDLHHGKITLDQAKAWTRAPDSMAQEAAWKALGARASVHDILKHFEKGALRGDDRLCKAVGIDAYLAAGGRIKEGLFGEAALWLDPKIVRRLADEKIAEARKHVEAEGWADVRTGKKHWNDRPDSSLGVKRKPTPEEKAELKGLQDDLKSVKKRGNELEDKDDSEEGLTEAEQRERDELYDREEALETKISAFDQRLVEYTPKDRAKAHAFVEIGDNGAISITRGIAPPKKTPNNTRVTKASGGGAKAQAQPPLNSTEVERLTAAAGGIIARAVSSNVKLALVLYCTGAAGALWAQGATSGELVACDNINAHTPDFKLATDKLADAEARKWKDKLAPHWKKAGAIETFLLAWSEADLLALFAFLVAQQIYTAEYSYRDDSWSKTARTRCAVIARAAGVDASTYTVDDDLFLGMSEAARAEAAKEMGVALLNKGAPKQHAAQLADAAGEKGWVHPIMREMLGLDAAAPKAKPAPKKTAAKKAPPKSTAAKKAVKK